MTDADALVQAADGLCGAFQNAKPESEAMKAEVNALVKIFKIRADMKQGPTDKCRRLRDAVQRQRGASEASEPQRVRTESGTPQRVPDSGTGTPQRVSPDEDDVEDGALLMPGLEVTYPSLNERDARPLVVSQDLDGPSQNTRAARRQRLLTTVEANKSFPDASKSANRQHPLQFLVDLAATVLDEETGEPLEYRHLIKRPKHKKSLGILLWQRDRKACPGDAQQKHWHQHNIFPGQT